MTRGKYAAKANGQRAQVAQNVAGALRAQIDEMRREHAAEVAGLKAQVSTLQGQLLRDVRNLAAAEVQQARSEAQAMLLAERTDRRLMVEKVAHLLTSENVKMREETYPLLAKMFGLEIGEFLAITAYAGDLDRATRRMSSAELNHSNELQRQQRSRPAVMHGHAGRRD